jgi:hypothetical protein
MPKFMHTSFDEPPQHATLYKETFPFFAWTGLWTISTRVG